MAVFAGICFGIWPIILRKSGLSGNLSSVIFSATTTLFVTLLSLKGWGSTANANWGIILTSGILSALGIICFNGMLAKATDEAAGTLFVTMILVQTTIPAFYDTCVNGGISFTKMLGFVLAVLSAILLLKG